MVAVPLPRIASAAQIKVTRDLARSAQTRLGPGAPHAIIRAMTHTDLPTDADPTTAALIAATLDADLKEVKRCLEEGADANAATAAGNSVLHTATLGGSADIAGLLIEHGADVHGRDKYGKTPLHLAARQGDTKLAELLVQSGADVNAMAKNGSHPLDWAEKFKHTDFVGFLGKHGATHGKALN